MLENSPADTTQLPTGCQPESLAKPVRRRSHKATQPQLLTRRASSTIIRLDQKTSKHVGGAANFFQNLAPEDFAEKAAHFLAELNAIHAFREGNGRSQLTFFDMLADHAGYPLILDKFEPTKMLDAMIASFGGDEHKLAAIIEGLIG